MGIQGLIPFLKKASKEVNIKNFSGCTVAIDAYCWLHKGAFSCAEKLVKGEKTDGYVYYCMKMVNMLLSCNIKPILVFDGKNLPSKTVTEEKRRENRKRYKSKGIQFLREGKLKEAKECFQRCVDVTSEMAFEVIQACRKKNVDCIVAPYEADAQLAYLNKCGIAQIIITEDSDLILFGCEKRTPPTPGCLVYICGHMYEMVIFKMDSGGSGIMVEKSALYQCMGLRAENFTFDKFRYMCILSGCDYLPSLPGIGLVKSCKFFSITTNPNLKIILSKLPTYLKMPNLVVTTEYKDDFIKANNTFLYQLVFCPLKKQLVPLNPYPPDINSQELDYAGLYFSDKIAYQLALGNINVHTMKTVDKFDPSIQLQTAKSVTWNRKATHMKSIWDANFQIPSKITLESPDLKSPTTKGKEVTINVKGILKPTNAVIKKTQSPSDLELFSLYSEPASQVDTFPPESKRLKTKSPDEKGENNNNKNLCFLGKSKPINIFKIDGSTPHKIVRSRFFSTPDRTSSKDTKAVPWLDEIQKEYEQQICSTPKLEISDEKENIVEDKSDQSIEELTKTTHEIVLDKNIKSPKSHNRDNCGFKWKKSVSRETEYVSIIHNPSVCTAFKPVKVTKLLNKENPDFSQHDIPSSPSIPSQLSNCSIDADSFSMSQDSDVFMSPSSQTSQNLSSDSVSPMLSSSKQRCLIQNRNSPKLERQKNLSKIGKKCRRSGLSKKDVKKKKNHDNDMKQLNLQEVLEKFKFQRKNPVDLNPLMDIDLTTESDEDYEQNNNKCNILVS